MDQLKNGTIVVPALTLGEITLYNIWCITFIYLVSSKEGFKMNKIKSQPFLLRKERQFKIDLPL